MRVGTIFQFIGGRLVGVALSGIIIGVFFVVVGATPSQFIAGFLQHPPTWVANPWFSPSLTIVGLCLIGASLWFNVWSRKQKAIDGLAEDMSFAIHDLVNRKPRPQTDDDIKKWKKDYEAWCEKLAKNWKTEHFSPEPISYILMILVLSIHYL